MEWEEATNEQVWAVLMNDEECPCSLLNQVFQEAIERGMIRGFILSIIKKKFGSCEAAQKLLKMEQGDLIQLGYEGAVRAMDRYAINQYTSKQVKFNTLLFTVINSMYDDRTEYLQAAKRAIVESDIEPVTPYLLDGQKSVEQIVLTKIQLEEKLDLLSDVQRHTLHWFSKGYTFGEIAEIMSSTKNTVADRIQKSFIKMTGHRINLRELGLFERPSYKKQGA